MSTANNTNKISNKRFFALLVLLLLSSVGMFGQEVQGTEQAVSNTEVSVENSESSQMELLMWINGSQLQMNNATIENQISTNGSAKKKYINCGMTPNRILNKTFLKKAMNRDQATA